MRMKLFEKGVDSSFIILNEEDININKYIYNYCIMVIKEYIRVNFTAIKVILLEVV